MKKIEKTLLDSFINLDNEKNFFKEINYLLQKHIGFKLLTFTVKHPSKLFVKRIYSSNNKVYPVGGIKKVEKNYFYELTFNKKRSFIGNNVKEIKKYFFDHKIITSLGAESILNQVVVFDKKTIGTINLLNIENHFNKNHLKITNLVSKFLLPTYLINQIKIK